MSTRVAPANVPNFNLTPLGGGVGLRHEQLDEILRTLPDVGWFEVIAENFYTSGGKARELLQEIGRHYPLIGHGVCLSVGSTDELDRKHLQALKVFLDQIKSPWFSDHLCFTMVDHTNLNDLIPLPFTEEAVANCVERIKIIQDTLERPFLVENVTRYITVSDREMSESEFITQILERANCGLLLDVTNLHLNSQFHGYDARSFMRSLPLWRVGQVHLSGWEPAADGTIIDSHDAPVPAPVWDLFAEFTRLCGPSSVLVEWDASLPSVERLISEAHCADALLLKECGFMRAKSSFSKVA